MEAGQMFRPRKRALGSALIVILTLVVIAACSATGGKKAAERAAAAAAGADSAGHANTPRYTFDVITHAQPGAEIGSSQDRVHLRLLQIRELLPCKALERNRPNLATPRDVFWAAFGNEAGHCM